MMPVKNILSTMVIISQMCSLGNANYGVDVSFPMHYPFEGNTFQKIRYDNMMEGCSRIYSKKECDEREEGRLHSNLYQPPTQYNYTELGFMKTKVPEGAFSTIKKFWEQNRDNMIRETWSGGNFVINHWDTPCDMLSVENDSYIGGGEELKMEIGEKVKPVIEEWIGGRTIIQTSMYGIRVYRDGAILSTHVDRLPLVTSCIVNVDQDVDEPWPLEVIGHNGIAYNITMEPGEMVLYESSTTLHGRPTPLKGRLYANIFIHYEPVDHKKLTAPYGGVYGDEEGTYSYYGETEIESEEGANTDSSTTEDSYRTELHDAARDGDINKVKQLIQEHPDLIHTKDINEWQPLHEAARAGQVEVVKYLLENGAVPDSVTYDGSTPLYLAKTGETESHGHIVSYLEQVLEQWIGDETEDVSGDL